MSHSNGATANANGSGGERGGSSAALREHAFYCFEVINSKLNGSMLPKPDFDDTAEFPLFVTWDIKPRMGGESRLRGCIGNFEPMPLGEGLRDYAAISAFKDHRFNPITAKELSRLECSVSLLTDFELCESILDWSIPTHGIYIQFPNPSLTPPGSSSPTPPLIPSSTSSSSASSSLSLTTPSQSTTSFRSISELPPFTPPSYPNPRGLRRTLNATYLPDVAAEQGWTKVEALDSAIRKAGWSGKVNEDIRNTVRVSRYQSQKVEVSYDEWQEWRKAKGL